MAVLLVSTAVGLNISVAKGTNVIQRQPQARTTWILSHCWFFYYCTQSYLGLATVPVYGDGRTAPKVRAPIIFSALLAAGLPLILNALLELLGYLHLKPAHV